MTDQPKILSLRQVAEMRRAVFTIGERPEGGWEAMQAAMPLVLCSHEVLRHLLSSLRTRHSALVAAARAVVRSVKQARANTTHGTTMPYYVEMTGNLEAALSGEAPHISQETAKKLYQVAADSLCECYDEYGRKRPEVCERCQAIKAAERELGTTSEAIGKGKHD